MTEEVEYDPQYYFCYESMAILSKKTDNRYTYLLDIFVDTKDFGEDTHITEDNYMIALNKWSKPRNSKPLEVRNLPNYDIKAIDKALEMYNGDTPTLP